MEEKSLPDRYWLICWGNDSWILCISPYKFVLPREPSHRGCMYVAQEELFREVFFFEDAGWQSRDKDDLVWIFSWLSVSQHESFLAGVRLFFNDLGEAKFGLSIINISVVGWPARVAKSCPLEGNIYLSYQPLLFLFVNGTSNFPATNDCSSELLTCFLHSQHPHLFAQASVIPLFCQQCPTLSSFSAAILLSGPGVLNWLARPVGWLSCF